MDVGRWAEPPALPWVLADSDHPIAYASTREQLLTGSGFAPPPPVTYEIGMWRPERRLRWEMCAWPLTTMGAPGEPSRCSRLPRPCNRWSLPSCELSAYSGKWKNAKATGRWCV